MKQHKKYSKYKLPKHPHITKPTHSQTHTLQNKLTLVTISMHHFPVTNMYFATILKMNATYSTEYTFHPHQQFSRYEP